MHSQTVSASTAPTLAARSLRKFPITVSRLSLGAALDEFAQEHGLKSLSDLACGPGVNDPVVMTLGSVLLPALAKPGQASKAFADYITLALCNHLVETYGDVPRKTASRRGLTPATLRHAMNLMAHESRGDVSIAEVARKCRLSRGYFSESFKAATGMPPHQWLQRHRVENAKSLLVKTDASIAEIAASCGFADQSHLTRVFSRQTGESPAAWRRQVRG